MKKKYFSIRPFFKSLTILFFLGSIINASAQVSTNGGSGLNAVYPSLNAAITALNSATISSPVVIDVQTAQISPVGGYTITAEGSAANTIVINGNNNLVTTNGSLIAGALNDAIFKLVGADYVTIQNFIMAENGSNTITNPATNNMTEWAVALLYATPTNGAQEITLQNNTISLDRNYLNSFGIYSNSTHSATNVTTSSSAIGTSGSNSGLRIYSNTISNVNVGIAVVGPIAADDFNQLLDIGGNNPFLGNSITDFGTGDMPSSFVNVSASGYGILVRNTVAVNIFNNDITSSNGAYTGSTALRGIYFPTFSNTANGAFTNSVRANRISIRPGASVILQGIFFEGNTANSNSTLLVTDNEFSNFGHTVPSSSNITFIGNQSITLNQDISNNIFNNISVNTSGNVTFIQNSVTLPQGGTQNVSNNSILGSFNKTSAGGLLTLFNSTANSQAGATVTHNFNNFSNITVTGATTIAGWLNADGGGVNKTFNSNTFSNWVGGSGLINCLNISFGGAGGGTGNVISQNVISNISGSGQITGILVQQNVNTANIFQNTVSGLNSTGAVAVTGISVGVSSTSFVYRNKIGNLEVNNANAGTVSGILITAGVSHTVYNNIVGDLRAPSTSNVSNDGVRGISVTSSTFASNVKLYYNTVFLNASSTGLEFSSAAIFHTTNLTATTAQLEMKNNLFVNQSVPNGNGVAAAYRRSSPALDNFGSSENNDFVGSAIFYDGTNVDQTINNYRNRVAPRDINSVSDNPTFLSTNVSSTNFLRIDPNILSAVESGAMNLTGFASDIDGDIRSGNPGYSGSGLLPDIGADEFESVLPACNFANGGNVNNPIVSICSGGSTTMMATSTTLASGITYQWQVSTVSGGPYINVSAGQGANSPYYTTDNLTSGTYYFVLEAVCTITSAGSFSNEVLVTVNQSPVLNVSPSNSTVCAAAGSQVTLNASGADNYDWSPFTNLSSITGSSVISTPESNITYTVVGTSASNGCTSSAQVTIDVVNNVLMSSVTASPAAVCAGSNSQLEAIAYLTDSVKNYVFNAGTGSTLADMSQATTVIGAGEDDNPTPVPLPIGFNFVFNGIAYAEYSVSPDGWLMLGPNFPFVQFDNDVQSSVNNPKIYPYWDDLSTGSDGSIKVLVSGTAPERIMIVEWNLTIPNNVSNPFNSTFQAWLHEVDGKIEYRYGNMAVAASSSISGGLTASPSNFHSITFAGNTSSTALANNLNSFALIPAGTSYTYTLPVAVNYSWAPDPTLSNISISNPVAVALTNSNVYTVTASSGFCSATGSVSVSVGIPLTVNPGILQGNVVCEGNTVNFDAQVSGGGGPYTYSWSGPQAFSSSNQNPVISNLLPNMSGTYSVTVSDNCGNSTLGSVLLTVNAAPSVTVNSSAAAYCYPNGANVVLTASGADTYFWTPSLELNANTGAVVEAFPSSGTTFTVVGSSSASGCTASAQSFVASSPSLTVNTISSLPDSICIGGNVQLTAISSAIPVSGYNYSTGLNAALIPMTGSTPLIAPSVNDAPVGPNNIGFNFNFNGVDYSQFSVSPDGWLMLGNGIATDEFNNFVTSSINIPKIYPYWDDLSTGINGSVEMLLTGTAPNRTLVVQWFVNTPSDINAVANSTFQALLHEADNGIEFRYGTMSVSNTDYSVGLTENVTNFNSVNTDNNLNSSNAVYNNNNALIQSGRFFSFVPSVISYNWTPTNFLNNVSISNPEVSGIDSTKTYTVNVSTGICSATADVTVSVTVPSTTSSVTTANCSNNDGSATANYVNGYTPLTFNWSDGQTTATASSLVSGNYSVTISDAFGCEVIITTTVPSDPGTLSANLNAVDAICTALNGSVTVIVNGGAQPYSFIWNNGATTQGIVDLAAGQYNVTVTDINGCELNPSATVTQSSGNLVVSLVISNVTIFNGNNGSIDLIVSGGTTPLTYIWSNGATTKDISGLVAGNYLVTVTDANGCENTQNLTVTQPVSVELIDSDFATFNLFPNPSAQFSTLTVDLKEIGSVQIRLLNSLGQFITFDEYNDIQTLTHKIDLNGLSPGVYMIEINTGGRIKTLRLNVIR